jgi:hypothetical protein
VSDFELLDRLVYGNSVRQWLIAAVTLGAVYVLLSLTRRVLVRRIGAIAARSATQIDDLGVDILRRTR